MFFTSTRPNNKDTTKIATGEVIRIPTSTRSLMNNRKLITMITSKIILKIEEIKVTTTRTQMILNRKIQVRRKD